jgi:hypothetical protein
VHIHQCHKPIQLKDKPIQLKDEEAEVNWENGSTTTRRHTIIASLGPCIWLPNTENVFRELVDLIRNAEHSRTHPDSPDFYCRGL